MKDFSIAAAPAPATKTGAEVAEDDVMIAWTGPGKPVYRLNLGLYFQGPHVVAYLSRTSFSWSDFAALGVDFGRGKLRGVVVSALYPYASLDELASASGPMATGTSWQRADSRETEIASIEVKGRARPSRFDLDDAAKLPTCASTEQAQPVGSIQSDMVDTRVSLRGILTLDKSWITPLNRGGSGGGCRALWTVVDPGGARLSVSLRRAEDAYSLEANASGCQTPNLPRIEVIATGVLFFLGGGTSSYDERHYLLDEASLCAVRPAPSPALH
jgi:hypothetical protein